VYHSSSGRRRATGKECVSNGSGNSNSKGEAALTYCWGRAALVAVGEGGAERAVQLRVASKQSRSGVGYISSSKGEVRAVGVEVTYSQEGGCCCCSAATAALLYL
jgi:hypothetical protein